MTTRTRLLERLAEGDRRLTLLVAAAGFGKTRLVVSSAGVQGTGVVRHELTARDADPAHLLAGIAAAVAGVAGSSTSDRTLDSLLDALSRAPPFTLFLDDVDSLPSEAEAAHVALGQLVERAPAQVRFAIAARTDPALPLGRLRARGEVLVLREADLRFSESEMLSYLEAVQRPPLDPRETATLLGATGGWIAGLELAVLAIRRGDAAVFLAELAEHPVALPDAAFAALPAPLREFYLACSILRRKDAPACAAVAEVDLDGATRTLSELTGEGLLCEIDLQDSTLHITHRVLDAHLVAALERDAPDHLMTLHRRAAAHFRERGLLRDAVEHAVAGGDLTLARELLSTLGIELLDKGERINLTRLLEQVDPDGTAAELASLRDALQPQPAEDADASSLSDRELSILRLLDAGYSTREIALHLKLSQTTVKTYARRIMTKLRARTKTDALERARKLRLLS